MARDLDRLADHAPAAPGNELPADRQNDGALYEIDVTNPGAASPASVPLGSGQIGAAALDSSDPANLLAIVGSTAGTVYAVKVPW